jgi:hypothetical protein
MSEIKKPAWVEALDSAKEILSAAAVAITPEEIDSKTRLAYAWIDIARLQKTDA